MNLTLPYLHALNGRLRIKIPAVKGSDTRARHVEDIVRSVEGVANVTANPITGSVLIFYDSARTSQPTIIGAIALSGYLEESATKRSDPHRTPLRKQLTQAVARSTVEFALHRLLMALV